MAGHAYLFLLLNEQISSRKGLLSTDRFYLCYMELTGRRQMELNRLDYVIMKLLKKKKCTSHFESMTLQEIMRVTGTSRPTTYRKMMNLCKHGYVEKGCKSTNADTFYLLEKGIKITENGGNVHD